MGAQYASIYKRQGLIIDVRHNHGGNIILAARNCCAGRVLLGPRRRFRVNGSTFRGHSRVVRSETASDGEAFTEGFHRSSWARPSACAPGARDWLSGSGEADGGIAATEIGVYGRKASG